MSRSDLSNLATWFEYEYEYTVQLDLLLNQVLSMLYSRISSSDLSF